MDIRKDFEFTSVSGKVPVLRTASPLGALAALIGTWTGHGFNQIWRPNQGADHFLELNETIETIEFTESLFQKPYAVVRLRGRLYRNRSRYFAPVSRRSIN